MYNSEAAFINGTFLSMTSNLFFESVICLCPPLSIEKITDNHPQIQYFGELVYYPGAFFTKTSILCLIARIFSPHRKAVLLARVIIVLMGFYYISSFFIKVFRCTPIHKSWNITTPGKCITTESSIFLADCIISLVTDLSILVLPMPLVWGLKISRKRKLRIMVVFAGGIL